MDKPETWHGEGVSYDTCCRDASSSASGAVPMCIIFKASTVRGAHARKGSYCPCRSMSHCPVLILILGCHHVFSNAPPVRIPNDQSVAADSLTPPIGTNLHWQANAFALFGLFLVVVDMGGDKFERCLKILEFWKLRSMNIWTISEQYCLLNDQ
uniref:Uncharacterized protein n=1 Tax=Oryza rufipogon TaxID=4529 RepID=A0A0E0PDJ1_ORYRU